MFGFSVSFIKDAASFPQPAHRSRRQRMPRPMDVDTEIQKKKTTMNRCRFLLVCEQRADFESTPALSLEMITGASNDGSWSLSGERGDILNWSANRHRADPSPLLGHPLLLCHRWLYVWIASVLVINQLKRRLHCMLCVEVSWDGIG